MYNITLEEVRIGTSWYWKAAPELDYLDHIQGIGQNPAEAIGFLLLNYPEVRIYMSGIFKWIDPAPSPYKDVPERSEYQDNKFSKIILDRIFKR